MFLKSSNEYYLKIIYFNILLLIGKFGVKMLHISKEK